MNVELSADKQFLMIHIPANFRKRGGEKLVIAAPGVPDRTPPKAEKDDALVTTVVKAFRWKRMLAQGMVGTMQEIADKEGVRASYVGRVMDLTLLAPDIIAAVLDGKQPDGLMLRDLMAGIPLAWPDQRKRFLGVGS